MVSRSSLTDRTGTNHCLYSFEHLVAPAESKVPCEEIDIWADEDFELRVQHHRASDKDVDGIGSNHKFVSDAVAVRIEYGATKRSTSGEGSVLPDDSACR